jgi:hypothetical protein
MLSFLIPHSTSVEAENPIWVCPRSLVNTASLGVTPLEMRLQETIRLMAALNGRVP